MAFPNIFEAVPRAATRTEADGPTLRDKMVALIDAVTAPIIEALERIVGGPTYVSLKGHGAAGDGVTNDSLAITAAYAASGPGAIMRASAGEYMIDAGTMALLASRRVKGDGMDTTWFTLIADTAGPAVDINVPTPSGPVRGVYGPALEDVGINLVNAPSAIGVRIGADGGAGITSGWTALRRVRVEGGAVSINNQATNVIIDGCHLINPSSRFVAATDTGTELRIYDTVLEVSPGVTVPVAIEVALASGGIKGALYLRGVACNNAGALNCGVRISCPDGETASMPLRAFDCTWDNVSGPAYDLVNVINTQVVGGWANCAGAGGHGAVRFWGGGNHVVALVLELNGGPTSGCTFDFAGAGTSYVTLLGNRPTTGPIYRLPATGKPLNCLIMDLLASGLSLGNVTNDGPGLIAAMGKCWTPQVLDYLVVTRNIQAGGPIRPGTYATVDLPSAADYGYGALAVDTTTGQLKMSNASTWLVVGP